MPPIQFNIFSHIGLHTIVRDVKESLNAEVKASGRSRDQVLDRLNELAKRHGISLNGRGDVSKDLLEKWLNAEDDSRAPGIKGLALLCAALETTAPIEALVVPLGGRVIGRDDVKLLEWAKAYQKSKELRKRMRKLEEELD
ncbi:MAG: hypothetical protein PHI97_00905 [Desulfobulbus sp.]|nr:hypothetical protein [Desulfobulbus sp.]